MPRSIWIVSAAMAIILSACSAGGASPTAAPSGQPSQVVQAQPTAAPTQPAPAMPAPTSEPTQRPAAGQPVPQFLVDAMKKTLSASYRSKIHTEGSGTVSTGGQNVELAFKADEVWESQGPDRFHRTVDSVTSLGGREVRSTLEWVRVGTTLYQRSSRSGQWQKSEGFFDSPDAGDELPDEGNQPKAKNPVTSEDFEDFKELGPELLNGAPTRVFSGKFSQLSWKVWVGVADGLVKQTYVEGTLGTGGAAGPGSIVFKSTQTYELDPSIKVEAPIQ